MKYIVEFLMIANATISSKSFIFIICTPAGWENISHCKAELENSEDICCQNSVLTITNGIRKVRKEVDIFDKRILDSCEFISDSASAGRE